MNKKVSKSLAVILVLFLIVGCDNQSTDKWSSGEITREDESAKLSVSWDGSSYKNDHIGFEVTIPDEWMKAPISELNIDDQFNDNQYDTYFEGSDDVTDSYPDVIKIMQAGSEKTDFIPDSIYLFVTPTVNDDVGAFMEYRRSLDEAQYADLDTLFVSEITSVDVGGKKTISYGIELTFEGVTYYQIYFAYYANGYFVVFSPAFSESSDNEANQILESVKIN